MTASSLNQDIFTRLGFRSNRFWREFTALFLMLMELAWLIPWYRTVIQVSYVASVPRTFLVLGGLVLFAYSLTLLLESILLLISVQRVILLVLFFSSLFLGSKLLLDPSKPNLVSGLLNLDQGAVLIVMVGLWLWWRGVSLARNPITPKTVWSRFWLGLVMMILYFLIITRATQESISFGHFALFFFTGLLAMVAARISFIGRYHGAKKSPFGQRWLAVTVITVGGVVSISTLLASLVTGRLSFLLDQLANGLRWLGVVIIFIISIPWLILSYLLTPLFTTIQNALPQVTSTPTPTPEAFDFTAQPLYPVPVPPPYRPIPPYFVSLIFWGLVIFLVVSFLIRYRTYTKQNSRKDEEETEALLDREGLLRKLREIMRKQLKDAAGYLNSATRLTRRQRRLAEARIRQIYQQLMDLCVQLESPRPVSATPLEFLPELTTLFPNFREDLSLITSAYIKVRYGELPESREEVDALELAWKNISIEGQRRKKLIKANLAAEAQANNGPLRPPSEIQ